MQDKIQIKEFLIKVYNAPELVRARPDILACLKKIKKFCRAALRDEALANSAGAVWLTDNYYVTEREAKALIKAGKKELMPYSRLYSYIEKLFFFTEYELTSEAVSSFFEVFSRNDFLRDREISSVQSVMKALLIERLAGLCDEIRVKKGLDMASVEKALENEKTARNIITSLRKSSIIDFGAYVMGYSPLERMFRLDPAGIYPKMDKHTQLLYRKMLEKKAKREGRGKAELLKEILAVCASQTGDKRHIGFYLADKPTGHIYIAILSVIFCILYVSAIFLCRNTGLWLVPSALLFVLPVFESARILADRIASKIKKPDIIPKMRFDTPQGIPDSSRTLTVITSLLFGKDEDEKLFERLEKFYLANRDNNLLFGILGDLKESKSESCGEDAKIISNALKNIRRLNEKYDGGFYLFIRGRVYSQTQGCYMGYERKRGAVIELCRFIRGQKTSINTAEGDISKICDIKYIVTLDSDTDVGLGQIAQMCGAMAHPLNKPEIAQRDGRFYVKSGYAIMQPVMSYGLVPSGKTSFCVLKSGAGGKEIYSSAAFDIYQAFFKSAMFCGKGIFDIDAFLKVIDGAFPDQSILSHDILEGCLLRCGLLNDVVLTDSLPATPLSYFKREHRWARGDVQAMAFAGKKVKNQSGNISINPISPLSKYKLWNNIIRMMLPLTAVLLTVVSLFCNRDRIALIGLSYIFVPFVCDTVLIAASRNFQQIFRKFTAHVISGIWSAFLNMMYDISVLFHRAVINTDALIRSVWRMNISKRRMLEWTTASEADKINGSTLFGYLMHMKFSITAGILFVLFSNAGIVRFLGIMFFISPFISILLSRPLHEKKGITPKQKEIITAYCRDMWGFFSSEVTASQNWLVPDNVQFSPVYSCARRSSPTNIGLYLLSAVAARDFGFISLNELYERINNTITTVEKMEKWHGHLFNWYDNRTLETVGAKYVSTVDSGNFVTCLVALKEALTEYCVQDGRMTLLVRRINAIIDNTDFRALYNSQRDLFYLGYNADSEAMGEGCYDLFMSEARTTGYFAVARGEVPKRHWSSIGRILISRGFYIGAASWTGTAFEYFMPALLLPVYKNSFSYEALQFAFSEQKRHFATADGVKVWGSSECGFYDFDSQMNYQYKAIGAPFLSLKHEESSEKVISPYSSFLMLMCGTNQVLQNLENLKKLGMYGKYGFYEAVDFTPSRTEADYARVESYMAHHVGMSILACANSVYGNIFRKRFMSDARMSCASELLEEKIPTDSNIFNDIDAGDIPQKPTRSPYAVKSESIDGSSPRIALFGGYRSSLRVSDCGHIWFERCGERRNRCINNPPTDITSNRHSFVSAVKINGQIYSPVRQLCDKDAGVKFEYTRDSAGFNITLGRRLVNMEYRLSANRCVLYNDITVNCREGDSTEYILYFEPVMESFIDYMAHPAFCALSVEAEYDAVNRIIIFRRRSRKAGEELYMAVGVDDGDSEISFETRADKLFFKTDNISDIITSDTELSCETGASINPRLFIRVKPSRDKHRMRTAQRLCFMVLCASTRERAVKAFLKARQSCNSHAEADALAALNTKKALQSSCENITLEDYLLMEKILRAASFFQNGRLLRNVPDERFNRGDLWKHSISGDVPIITVAVQSEQQLTFCARMIMLHRLCFLKRFYYDLVFLVQESEEYTRPIYTGLRALSSRYKSDYLVGKKGGLFFVTQSQAQDVLRHASSLWLDGDETDSEPKQELKLPVIITQPDKNHLPEEYDAVLETFGGDFTDCGFVIDKIGKRPPLAYAHVLSNRIFGSVITQNSLGYTWFSNSHEKRLTRFENSPYDSFVSETVYMQGENGIYDLCACASQVHYGLNCAVYYGRAEDTRYSIEVFVHEEMAIKSVRVRLSQQQRVFYSVRSVLGSSPDFAKGIYYVKGENSILFGSPFTNQKGVLLMPKTDKCRVFTSPLEAFCTKMGINDAAIVGCTGKEAEFALCSVSSQKAMEHTVEMLKRISFDSAKADTDRMTRKLLGSMLRNSVLGDDGVDVMYNLWLGYQAIFCRFFARGALYQSGGAYGFRDQLQDCRIFFRDNPRIARRHIIRCAAHQFEEGDAQHWWHNIISPDGTNPGIRSRCSDDYLWLVMCTCEYVEVTGDRSVLDVKVRYIADKPLLPTEAERYSSPLKSDVCESVYEHCKRAVELFIKRGLGAHGLPFIGSCDWNDGFSALGEQGRGESVWLGLFGRIVLEKFAVIAKSRGEDVSHYHEFSDTMGRNIDKNAYNGKWFVRGFYDDGSPLGDEVCDECKIDILPQAFSAMVDKLLEEVRTSAHRSPAENIQSALEYAYEYLYDKENRILKLFAPPFDKTDKNPGYIKSYAPGLRENGGQYTHGAVWGAMGFLSMGQEKRAREITYALCPAQRAQDKELFEKYKTEPYVLCGDVYSNPAHTARGGWSWYTGSAAWYYELIRRIKE